MSDNLVDTMMEEMTMNNSAMDMGYQPHMSQPSPVQSHGDVRMGDVQYVPPDMEMGGMGQMQQYPMHQPIAGQPPMQAQQAPMSQAPPQAYVMGEEDEAPDFNSYGMEEESGLGSLFGFNFGDLKDPLIVVALAVILSLPQVQRLVRNTLARFVQNPLYINILQAVILGVGFYLVRTFL